MEQVDSAVSLRFEFPEKFDLVLVDFCLQASHDALFSRLVRNAIDWKAGQATLHHLLDVARLVFQRDSKLIEPVLACLPRHQSEVSFLEPIAFIYNLRNET